MLLCTFPQTRYSAHKTRSSTANSIILDIPQYMPSLPKSTKHVSTSFSFDAPKIWNYLPADIRSAPILMSFRTRLKAYLFWKGLSSLASPYPVGSLWCSPGYFPDSWFLEKAYCSKHRRVCFADIKCY